MSQVLFCMGIFVAGAIAGFINIMAGGGSVLTLGLMMLMGMDASVANGTNRIGLLVGGISGAAAYSTQKVKKLGKSLVYGLICLPGAILGAVYAVHIGQALFTRIFVVIMIWVVITFFLPQTRGQEEKKGTKSREKLIYPAMFLIGFYGGFIQVGIGFLIMLSFRYLSNISLVEINMHKTYIVLIYTLPILLVFGFTDNIHWLYAGCLALGNALGAWMSVKVSLKKGDGVVKIVLAAAILLMGLKLLIVG